MLKQSFLSMLTCLSFFLFRRWSSAWRRGGPACGRRGTTPGWRGWGWRKGRCCPPCSSGGTGRSGPPSGGRSGGGAGHSRPSSVSDSNCIKCTRRVAAKVPISTGRFRKSSCGLGSFAATFLGLWGFQGVSNEHRIRSFVLITGKKNCSVSKKVFWIKILKKLNFLW